MESINDTELDQINAIINVNGSPFNEANIVCNVWTLIWINF